ncbi:restriction endonuclease subunit S [Lactobacillus amylovorus]|uniref:restriction endonuclease subunit S n=1 Tax=Lactobacillus amylovorus TaxID=1604 RepID=UPI00232AE1E6|nr:restriction endonuclease subunit S [Lactobacillus amylovorus]MDB6233696.1 restriction endonuclease subunit S [Lactobacillus amylovorus]
MTPEQLKASILQYAMEGKLVKQDPNDEPASELLKKIENEKAKLVKEGKINKERAVRPVKEEEKDGVLPTGWTYTRFQNISLFTTDYVANGSFKTLREHTHKYKEKNYALFVRTMDLSANFKSNLTYIDKDSYDFLSKSKLFGGELILPNIGGSIGKAFLMPNLNMPMSLAPNSIMVKFTEQVMNKYFSYFIQSPMGKSLLLNNKGGTATPKFSKTELRNMVLKLPPLEEQKRIVAKIEKLMPLVDEYAESYNRLQKIDNEFEDKLKQSVLQYAMEGKLVKQNPSDEPASELIKKIENEKAELVKEGKIKKSKKLPAITDDEKPFDIPNSWEWVKLGNIVDYVQRGKSPKYDKESTRYPIISQKCVQWDGIHLEFAKHLKEDFWEGLPSYRFVTKGDLLFNSTGTGTVGRVIKVTEPFNKVPVDSHVTVIRLNQNICNSYILYFLMSPIIQKNLDDYLTGTTKQKELGLASIQNIVVSLPPLEEQKRIVAKIEKIMNSINNH